MGIVVRYHSTTGNTKKVAEAIAGAAGCSAEPISSGLPAEFTDVLFLGGAVYATHEHSIPPALRAFIGSLDPKKIGKVHVFCTGFTTQANGTMKSLLEHRGIRVAPDSFFCKGKLFTVFNFGHPNTGDLAAAGAFARKVVSGSTRK